MSTRATNPQHHDTIRVVCSYLYQNKGPVGLPGRYINMKNLTRVGGSERVFVITNNDPSSLVFNEFDGTIVGFKLNGIIIQVKDQHDDVFDCDASQVHYYDRFII